MRAVLALLPVAALAACATAPQPAGAGGEANANDCAVIAAVAREHYGFNDADRLPPPLWLDGEGERWTPGCDWSRHGLRFPSTFDPDAPVQTGGRVQWVSFKRPRYDGSGAEIEAGILHGPLAGMGIRCRVVSGIAGWTLAEECRTTWIS
jgi:hypothetical protein